jgi:transcriptional regulator with XRE-family HTH domain
VKELRVMVRVKNNRLLERREKLGLTQVAMAEVIGVRKGNYCELENLRRSPVAGGVWTEEVLQVAEYFDCEPEELFPDAVFSIKEPSVERRVDVGEILPLLSANAEQRLLPPDERIELRELADGVEKALSALTPREEDVLRKHYGLGDGEAMTFDEIAESRSDECQGKRLFQVAGQAMGKMRKMVFRSIYHDEPVPERREEVVEPVVERRRGSEYSSVMELLDARTNVLEVLRMVRDVLATDLPSQARVKVDLRSDVKHRLDLRVLLSSVGKEEVEDVGCWLRREISAVGADPYLNVQVEGYPEPEGRRPRPGSLTELAADSVAGGFEVVGRNKEGVRLRLEPGPARREQLLRMRLWFCDRADVVALRSTEVVWRMVDGRVG